VPGAGRRADKIVNCVIQGQPGDRLALFLFGGGRRRDAGHTKGLKLNVKIVY
jgi:hypothetical protein